MNKLLVYILIAVVFIAISFYYLGFAISNAKNEKQSAISFANIIGQHTSEMNEVYSKFTSKDQSRDVYNELFIKSIGCSSWLTSLQEVEKEDLVEFYEGINTALKHSEGSLNKDNSCVNTVFEWLDKKP
jgi:hypothetical protein